jgi:hypothetical protein
MPKGCSLAATAAVASFLVFSYLSRAFRDPHLVSMTQNQVLSTMTALLTSNISN